MKEVSLSSLLSFTIFFFTISYAIDTITPAHPLSNGDTLISPSGTFTLGFFTPPSTNNSYVAIWYHNLPVTTVVWVANRRNPIPNLNATLSITSDDASLHLTTFNNSTPLWSSPSFPNSTHNPVAQLLDNGNFIIKSFDSNSILWQSSDDPTDTLLAGMKLGPDLKTGIARDLISWLSPSDPSPGKYVLAIDLVGVPQMVVRDSSNNWIWRGGSWNGFGFSGAGPDHFFDVGLFREFISNFTDNQNEVCYYFNVVGGAISRLTMDEKGTVRRYAWEASSQNWDLEWLAPNDTCDYFPACGLNAVCDLNASPICGCLHGFDPRNPVGWGRGDWSDGCVRASTPSCGPNGTDQIMLLRSSKLPDTREAVKDMSLGMDECKTRCLMNCSCKAYALADLSNGGNGCIMWMSELNDLRVYQDGGQDLFVRVGSGGQGSGKRKLWIFVVASVAFVLLLLIVSLVIFMKRRRKREIEEEPIFTANWGEIMHKFDAGKEGSSEISLFQFNQIVTATNNFSNFNKLGEGGFGPVYMGKLSEGQDVAIKRLSARSGQGLEEFKNEILSIAKLQHRNLVRLLGCCIHGEEKMLIYEFMPNKSLDLFLFDVKQKLKLDWTRRFQIIEGIAQGLLYLHKHSRLRVIHRDLKASNILLDADMNPKISDFGMARIFDANETQANTRRIVGTYGYMSPEYAFNGLFSVKSDAFSFGVMILEIVSGRRNAGFHEFGTWCNLLACAWDLWKEGTWMKFVDPALDNQFQLDEVARCIYVALLCVQESPNDRPDMTDVISMLTNENLQFNIIKQPAFFTMKIASDSNFSLPHQASNSSNALSVSIITGR